jgi:hypothetical protein
MRKKDIISKYKPSYSNIEIGDYVMVTDGSYMLTINGYKLEHLSKGLSDEIFKVVGVNQQCPTHIDKNIETENILSHNNNCIIKSLLDGQISFCSKINIVKVSNIDFSELDERNVNKGMIREYSVNSLLS